MADVSPTAIQVIIAGAAGRMGSRLVACLADARDLRLVAALEAPGHRALGTDAGEIAGVGRLGVPLTSDGAAALVRDRVLIEFSTPEATLEHVRLAAGAGTRAVIGTTGFSPAQRDEIAGLARRTPIVLAPNFSVGVTVALKALALVARALGEEDDGTINLIHTRSHTVAP